MREESERRGRMREIQRNETTHKTQRGGEAPASKTVQLRKAT